MKKTKQSRNCREAITAKRYTVITAGGDRHGMYDAPDKYPKGTEDENYYAEIWIPVNRK